MRKLRLNRGGVVFCDGPVSKDRSAKGGCPAAMVFR